MSTTATTDQQRIEPFKQYLSQKPDFVKLWEQEQLKQTAQSLDETSISMPVLPQEEETHGNLTDQVAKESSNSTASSHPMHQEQDQGEKGKASIQDHHATPGPAMSDNMPEASSKEDLKKRVEELNKNVST